MLARSAWAWLVLIAAWASLVASKSPAVVYEMMSAYHIYNIAWLYEGADQRYIYPLLDKDKDKTLFDKSYRQQGHRGSLDKGQMNWGEFCVAWFKDDRLSPDMIPELDMNDLPKTARALSLVSAPSLVRHELAAGVFNKSYYVLLTEWMDMVLKARKKLATSTIAKDLKGMGLASEKAADIRRAEFWQMEYLGQDMKRLFPGLDIKSRKVDFPEFEELYKRKRELTVVDVLATITSPLNKAKMPAILGLPDNFGWEFKFMNAVNEYGASTYGANPKRDMEKSDWTAHTHHRMLMAVERFELEANDYYVCDDS